MSRRAKQPMAFAERLRVLRGNSGMTQWQIAQALNISRSAYAYYETGATRPDFDTLTRLAQIFRVSTDYLLGVDENVQPVLTMNSVRPRYASGSDGAESLAMLSEDEQSFLILYRQMDTVQKDKMLDFAMNQVAARYGDTEN